MRPADDYCDRPPVEGNLSLFELPVTLILYRRRALSSLLVHLLLALLIERPIQQASQLYHNFNQTRNFHEMQLLS